MHKIGLFLIIIAAASAAPSLDNRIVGGDEAALGEFPYVISLQKSGRHSCGGSILSENYILTAAHCVASNEHNPSSLKVQYGVIKIGGEKNVVSVKRVIKNKDYNTGPGHFNDVAVLELNEKLKFGPNAQPVRLPDEGDSPGSPAPAVLVGWGRTDTNAPTTKELRKVNITLFTHAYCQSKEENYNPTMHVCAGVPLGGHGQCNGDSGGPLTVNGVQYGIVSWSIKPCTSVGHPGVFGNVVSFRKWIKDHSGV